MAVELYIFESIEDARAFKSRVQTQPRTEVDHEVLKDKDPIVAHQSEKPPLPRKKYEARTKPKAAGKGNGKMHCKICGKPGRSDGHPEHKGPSAYVKKADRVAEVDKVKRDDDGLFAGEDDDSRSSPLTGEDLHAAIQGLKEDGLDSIQIASRLKITLKVVNANW